MESIEVWKNIAGYEGLYMVSNLGRVKSLEFRNGACVKSRERIMTPTDNGNGYKIVGLRRGNHKANHYVHRLVAEAFIPNPKAMNVVNHIDFDKGNNKADNLEWCSQTDNVMHSLVHMVGIRKPRRTNTGENYITKRRGRYRVIIDKKEYPTSKTIEEAVALRDAILEGR